MLTKHEIEENIYLFLCRMDWGKRALAEITITDKKKLILNLFNKIINKNFKKQDSMASKLIKTEKGKNYYIYFLNKVGNLWVEFN